MTTLELLSTPGMSGSKKMMDLYNASQKRMDRNIQTQIIVKYESGEGYTPGIDKVCALADVFGSTPNKLIGYERDSTVTAA